MSILRIDEIKILEWSLNFKSDKNAIVAKFVSNWVKEFHIIVFIEVVKNDSTIGLMKELGDFNFFESQNSIGNKIFIAIKKEFQVTNIVTKIPNCSDYISPNFLQLEILLNNIKYQIIGTRIRIGTTPSKYDESKYITTQDDEAEDYINRKKQFEALNDYISDFINVIVIGDFNNSNILGEINAEYKDVKYKYAKKYLTKHYNYHLMKQMLKGSFTVNTPKDKFSWGLQFDSNKETYKWGYIKNDHVISSNNLIISSIDYNWEFVEKNDNFYTRDSNADEYGMQKVLIKNGVPDHAMLIATLKI